MGSARIDFNIEMRTPDGVTLRADVYRPETDEPVPAILMRTPYNNTERAPKQNYLPPSLAVENGLAFVIQDTLWVPETRLAWLTCGFALA